jgi:hypothetical protein
MDIADDYEYLSTSDFFLENVGKLFRINRHRVTSVASCGSRNNKERLQIESDVVILDDVVDVSLSQSISGDHVNNEGIENLEDIYTRSLDVNTDEESDSESDGDSREDNESGEEAYTDEDDEEDDGEDEEDEDEEDNNHIYAYIDNFPTHSICLERCDGTLDDLLVDDEIDDETGASALFQVIIILIAYQKMFNFTHNDLHTNNIMYIETDIEYLYYKFDKITYRVPTHGRIFKLIDFGRSIYKVQGKLFCSDSFAVGGDASTQYNFEPFYSDKYPRLDPNYSFDLCRLGCSIYDFMKPKSELYKTIHRWCLDDKKQSVIYKKNGEERYPDFKLYKMIAKTVHAHTPQAQLGFPFFSQFKYKIVEPVNIMDIDAMPSYTLT